ncbi:hypothetical protein EVG80_15160 [Salmonella enterica subsp. enterica serovar Mississippi]|nr:hypothetical protein [Salmonella enterica subsp. enterica serovar Mississippi]
MSENSYLLTEQDAELLTTENLMRHADYQGDHEVRLMMRAMARKLLLADNPQMDTYNVELWIDSHIRELKAPMRVMNVLYACGFETIRQVFEGGYDYLLRQNSFGLRCKDDLCEIFRRHGLLFRAHPCNAPVKRVVVKEAMVNVSMPHRLALSLVNACHHNLSYYERTYGRYALESKRKDEHDRLKKLVDEAEEMLRRLESQNNG